MTASRLLILLIAAVGLLVPAASSQAVAQPPGQYAGGVSSFGDIVGLVDEYLLVVDKAQKTVSVLDADSLAFQVSNLLSLPGVPQDISQIIDADVHTDATNAPAQVAVLVNRPSAGFEFHYNVLVFQRVTVLGSSFWALDWNEGLDAHSSTTTFDAGRLAWNHESPADDPRLFVALTDDGGDISVLGYDTTTTGVADLVSTYYPPSGPAGGTEVVSLATAESISPFSFFARRVYIGTRNKTTFESEIHVIDFSYDTDNAVDHGVLSAPSPGITGFGNTIASEPFALGFLAVTTVDGVLLYRPGDEFATDLHLTQTLALDPAPAGFGYALSFSSGRGILAISQTHNEFGDPLNHAGMLRLARRPFDDEQAEWELTGEVLQAHVDPTEPNIFFGRDIAIDKGLQWLGGEEPRLAAGAPFQNTVHLFGLAEASLADTSWVDTSLSPGLAGHGGETPRLHLLGGLYAVPGLVPGPLLIGLRDARPNASAFLVVGLGVLNAPFKQGVLYPSPYLLMALPTNAEGEIDLPLAWSEDAVAAGPFDLPLQFWVQDADGPKGFASSDGGVLRQD